MVGYSYTTQKQVRAAFWRSVEEFKRPGSNITRKKITNYAGTGKMHTTDTRVAFGDFVDALSKDGEISQELATRVTLS